MCQACNKAKIEKVEETSSAEPDVGFGAVNMNFFDNESDGEEDKIGSDGLSICKYCWLGGGLCHGECESDFEEE
jgi:hypothetical protein